MNVQRVRCQVLVAVAFVEAELAGVAFLAMPGTETLAELLATHELCRTLAAEEVGAANVHLKRICVLAQTAAVLALDEALLAVHDAHVVVELPLLGELGGAARAGQGGLFRTVWATNTAARTRHELVDPQLRMAGKLLATLLALEGCCRSRTMSCWLTVSRID